MSQECVVRECVAPAKSRGLCNKHYLRKWRTGDTELPRRRSGVTLICPECGELFYRERRHVTSVWGNTCSYKCAARLRGKNLRRAEPDHRFFEALVKEGECWVWPYSRDKDGYGKTGCRGVQHERTHRVAYEIAVGPVPDGMMVMHKCDNPPCCRPDHLTVGTAADNAADMVAKGRHAKQRRKA